MERYLVDILPDEGLHGRRVITTNEQEITADNVVKVLNTAIATHDRNRGEIQYLWDVYRGKQDIRKKEKIVREEINNKITVNIANEIVTFKTAFLLSGPVQYIGAKGSKTDNNKLVDLNRWMSDEDKQSKDKEIVDWMHIAGLGVRMVLPDPGAEQAGSPACIYTLDPREAFVIYYSGYTKKPMAGVLTQYDENDAKYYGVYTDSEYFEIKSGKITRQSGHLYGSVPIVEYPNNSARMGAFEVVLPLLNGINTLESNRVDNVQDFVNAYDVFQNVDLEDGQYSQLASGGKFIKIKDSQQGMPAKIYRISSEMNSSTVQTAVDDLHDKILTIEAAGYYGILYASCDFIRNRLDYKALSKYDIWVAQYSSKCTCPLPYGIWQYSSRNALGIPGYGTSLDCNRVYKDYERLMIQAGLQGHTAPTPEDTTPNKLDKQRITIGRISSGDRATIRALCEGLGLIAACLYRETCADGNQWMLDVGPVSSGDAWYIMRKCSELQLIEAGLYKAEYVG